jgi:hypothetical protein
MKSLQAFSILIVCGALVFAVTIGISRVPRLFSKKKKKSCCE